MDTVLKNEGAAFRRRNGQLIQRGHTFTPTEQELAEYTAARYIGNGFSVVGEEREPSQDPASGRYMGIELNSTLSPAALAATESFSAAETVVVQDPIVELGDPEQAPAVQEAGRQHAGKHRKHRHRR